MQTPKNPNASREVDLPKELAALLRSYVSRIPPGYLFATKNGTPISQRNALRALHKIHKVGLHAFRRFRTSHLREQRVLSDLITFWIGHATKSVTDDYVLQIRQDLALRKKEAEAAGLASSCHLGCMG